MSSLAKTNISPLDKYRLLQALCRTDLSVFTRKVFDIVSPNKDFLNNWHIELIAKYLKACQDGDIKRLIINIPPRHLKSISVAVAFPAWLLGHNPSERILCASYSQNLALKHSLDCRAVVQHPFYKELFPETILVDDQNTKSKFMTTERGFRYATSVGGTATGEGGNFLIIDDPLSANNSYSEAFRNTANQWFDQTFSTRLDDKKKGCIIVVMQRLHEDDLTGHLLAKEGWEHLKIPLVAEEDETYSIRGYEYKRKEGELLHEERMGHQEVIQAKIDSGDKGFSGQYQQSPVAAGGNIIKNEWIRTYKELPHVKRYSWSWDTAIKVGQENDYSVGTLWAECETGYYLIDLFRQKIEYPELRKSVNMLYNKQKTSEVLVEDKASGQQIVQDFKRIGTMPVIAVMPGKDMPNDKEGRMHLVSGLFEAGKIFIPEDAEWAFDFIKEMTQFPNGKHDDICDSTTQYLIRRLNMQNKRPSIRII